MIKTYYITLLIGILFLFDFIDGIFSTQESYKILGFIIVNSKIIFLLYKFAIASTLIFLGLKSRNQANKN